MHLSAVPSMARTFFFIVCSLLPFALHASTLRWLSLSQLSQASSSVLLGRALDQTSFWQEGRIYTRTRLAVEEVWQGKSPGETVEVLTLGGSIGTIGQRVEGAGLILPNERVVVCL